MQFHRARLVGGQVDPSPCRDTGRALEIGGIRRVVSFPKVAEHRQPVRIRDGNEVRLVRVGAVTQLNGGADGWLAVAATSLHGKARVSRQEVDIHEVRDAGCHSHPRPPAQTARRVKSVQRVATIGWKHYLGVEEPIRVRLDFVVCREINLHFHAATHQGAVRIIDMPGNAAIHLAYRREAQFDVASIRVNLSSESAPGEDLRVERRSRLHRPCTGQQLQRERKLSCGGIRISFSPDGGCWGTIRTGAEPRQTNTRANGHALIVEHATRHGALYQEANVGIGTLPIVRKHGTGVPPGGRSEPFVFSGYQRIVGPHKHAHGLLKSSEDLILVTGSDLGHQLLLIDLRSGGVSGSAQSVTAESKILE